MHSMRVVRAGQLWQQKQKLDRIDPVFAEWKLCVVEKRELILSIVLL